MVETDRSAHVTSIQASIESASSESDQRLADMALLRGHAALYGYKLYVGLNGC